MIAARSERGQVLPLIAVCLAVLMLFAGLVVDVGYWSYQQRQQQNAADAAALGGAQALLAAGCTDVSAAQTAGQHDAQANGYTNGSGGVAVTIDSPSTVGPYAGQSCSVSAVIKNNSQSLRLNHLGSRKNDSRYDSGGRHVDLEQRRLHLPDGSDEDVSIERCEHHGPDLWHHGQQLARTNERRNRIDRRFWIRAVVAKQRDVVPESHTAENPDFRRSVLRNCGMHT